MSLDVALAIIWTLMVIVGVPVIALIIALWIDR